MNPYRPTALPSDPPPFAAALPSSCPHCGHQVHAARWVDGLRPTVCIQCRHALRRQLPRWAQLSTVLVYLTGLLFYFLTGVSGLSSRSQNFWEVHLAAVLLLILVPHLISNILFRRYALLIPVSDSRL